MIIVKLIKMLRQKVYEAFSETLESQRLLRLGMKPREQLFSGLFLSDKIFKVFRL